MDIIRAHGDTREVPESPHRLVHRVFLCIRVNAVLACIHIHMLMGAVALMIPLANSQRKKRKCIYIIHAFAYMLELERCILLHKAKCTDRIDVPQRGMISRSTIHLQFVFAYIHGVVYG